MASMRPVQPVRPVAAWIGGKRLLAQRIVQQIEQVPHDLYCEAFLGMGGVFLRRRRRVEGCSGGANLTALTVCRVRQIFQARDRVSS
jgi:hypothetical protein